ncbi:MAG TPA: M3 family oligoendopeptidase [Candidatus Dormibacteraeota bacterium]|nr:M3 family oligoendopeptidase [Candidatus Dormibacteraeota bacterium]
MTVNLLLPDSADVFRQAKWADIEPYYQQLASEPLDETNVEEWLTNWSHLEALIEEASALAYFAYTCNTADPQLEEAQLRFGSEIEPKSLQARAGLQKRLVDMGYDRPGLKTAVERFRNQVELFRDENVPLFSEVAKLETEWAKVNGAMTVDWDGEQKTPAQLLPFLESQDRAVRERAFKLRAQPFLDQRDVLAGIFDRMLELRQQVGRNAGFANYRDFIHREKNRFDYTPDDCMRFHAAVEEVMRPACGRIQKRRKDEMGVEALRPWDTTVDPLGRPALKPFGDVREFIERTSDVVAHVDPDFRGYINSMAAAGLLDLENRKGKAPGGYSWTLPFRKMPLIFMNAVGIDDDVKTLVHEAGHAFHGFEASRLPLVFQRHPGSEMAEVASMSMELLTSPYITSDNGGYYSAEEARRSIRELLEGVILFFPHCASVDAFQHWIYTEEAGADADARDQKWLELRRRFESDVVDWSGLDRERIARWYQQPHFFANPFYYIEYGIAQLGALQVWRNSLGDRLNAVRNYRSALALGATERLPDLYAAAGARLVFDSSGMKELASVVEEQLEKLYD